MNILVTGTSGFIGYFTAKHLLERGDTVIGYDCENDYYDVNVKYARRHNLETYPNFKFYKENLEDLKALEKVFTDQKIDKVFNPAAQAGVRYSLENPFSYVDSNLVGFHNILNLATKYKVKKFVYASSSSVYGTNKKQPFSVDDKVDNPMSIYAATKKANELIAHSYSHLYKIPTIGLRFFTVYWPSSRPDMAMYKFAKKMIHGEQIDVYNFWKMKRDFTYIDDIVSGVVKCIDVEGIEYDVFNLGNHETVELEYMISLIEKELGITANKNYMPIQAGDVPETWADIEHTQEVLHWEPTTSIEVWVKNFADWFKDFHKDEYENYLANHK